ncbi:MAG: glycosyltransferase family 4 protein [Solirubrobacterales bacterium]|nr:glycosyltransferase family 4 protein [Solirubrobacterales bacterium]
MGKEGSLRVGLLAPSPIPFKVPLYRRIAAADGIDLTVIYASSAGVRSPSIGGYGTGVYWDSDLLGGYRSRFLAKADDNLPNRFATSELADSDVIGLVRRERFDVLWSEGYNWLTNLFAIGAQRSIGGGVVLRDTQNLLHPRGLAKSLVKQLWLVGLFGQIDAAVYIGRENRRWLEHYGFTPEQLFSAPYGTDTDKFVAEARELIPRRRELRSEFGFAEDVGPIVLSASRLVPAKQPLMLLEAFRRVRLRRRCGLLVVGSGEEETEMRARVEAQSIPDVIFAGFLNQSEISRAYAAADIFGLLSAWGETYGVVVAEALYFGLPLLLSDKVGSAGDLLGDGGNGYLVARDDVGGAADALERMVADPELRARFSAESSRKIAARGVDSAAAGALAAIRYAAEARRR